MISKILNYFNHHRFILVLFILIIIIILFILIKFILFKTYQFPSFSCTNDIDNATCYYHDLIILKDPHKTKDQIFIEYESYINELQKKYELPEFNNYTAYLYKLASNYDFNINKRNETLNTFFNNYVNTYNF